ncbi:hypothetical protein WJX72_008491 [[Myrmecia] bisecta]|uniref:Methylenetetrahydrofolate reductase (NAD(P)H) n=1 Tax=[Myrmecia] bisecta TaxID=41462 RepID=A0AAW1QRS2_9CHLO
MHWRPKAAAPARTRELPPSAQQSHAGDRWQVTTVAAQLRSRDQIERELCRAAGRDVQGTPLATGQAADALLLLSGGHPVRRVPGLARLLPSSLDSLRMAARLRGEGVLPAEVSLWAVENPLVNQPSRLVHKIEAGAQVVITQPPLLWGRFDQWIQEVHRQGLHKHTRLVIGMPIISSTGNLDFWLRLCNARGQPGAADLLQHFGSKEAEGRVQFWAFCRQWNRRLVEQVCEMPGVAGLHIMPLTKTARQITLEFLQEDVLPTNQ